MIIRNSPNVSEEFSVLYIENAEFHGDIRNVNIVQYCHVQAYLMHTLSFIVQRNSVQNLWFLWSTPTRDYQCKVINKNTT